MQDSSEQQRPHKKRMLVTDYFSRKHSLQSVEVTLGVDSVDQVIAHVDPQVLRPELARAVLSAMPRPSIAPLPNSGIDARPFMSIDLTKEVEDESKMMYPASEIQSEEDLKKLSSSKSNKKKSRPLHYNPVPRLDQAEVVIWMLKNKKNVNDATKNRVFASLKLNKSSLKRWKTEFLELLKKVKLSEKNASNDILYEKAKELYVHERSKLGRPTLLPHEQHVAVLQMMWAVRQSGGRINPLIVVSLGSGVMKTSQNASLLTENGGSITLTEDWARSIIRRVSWTSRKSTTTRKLAKTDAIAAAKEAQLIEQKIAAYLPDLVLEMDETLAPWVPCDDRTFAPMGCEKVQIQGINDRRGNTATITISRSGNLLPLQLIWEGKTDRSIPKFNWPDNIINCFSGPSSKKNSTCTKWQNAKTIKEYSLQIIKPYMTEMRTRLLAEAEAGGRQLEKEKLRGLLILDHHWSHECADFNLVMADIEVDVLLLPKSATDLYSVLDVSLNRPFKSHLRQSFTQYCTEIIVGQLQAGIDPSNVKMDLRTSVIKPRCSAWIVAAYESLRKSDLIEKGWNKVSKNIEIVLRSDFNLPEESKEEESKGVDDHILMNDIEIIRDNTTIRSKTDLKPDQIVNICFDGCIVGEAIVFNISGDCHGVDLDENNAVSLARFQWKDGSPDFDLPVQGEAVRRSDLSFTWVWAFPIDYLSVQE
jgi:hypothetical protein